MQNRGWLFIVYGLFTILLLVIGGCTSNGIGTNTQPGGVDEVDAVQPQSPAMDGNKIHTQMTIIAHQISVIADPGAAEPNAEIQVAGRLGYYNFTANSDGSFEIHSDDWPSNFDVEPNDILGFYQTVDGQTISPVCWVKVGFM